MPTLEKPHIAIPRRTETVISTAQRGWQQLVVRAMRQQRRFVLETACASFDPSDTSASALLTWLQGSGASVARCDLPAAFGIVLLGAALLIPHPITKSLLGGASVLCLFSVGFLMLRLVVARHSYRWRVSFNPERRVYTWLAEPVE